MSGNHTELVGSLRDIASGRVMLRASNGVTVPRSLLVKAAEAIEALTHASDCDKQECMGDASPGDAKDLQELLAKPSVLEPSDRPADCDKQERELTKREQYCVAAALLASGTVVDETLRRIEEINENRRNAAINADNIVAGNPSDRTAGVTVELKPFEWSKITAYEACNGTLWRTAEEATVESRRARDAFTVGRR